MGLGVISALVLPAAAAAEPRITTPLTDGWRFFQGDPEGTERRDFEDRDWAVVSVPHDWAIAGPFDQNAKGGGENGFLPTGVAWYRRDLDIRPEPGRRYFVELDGVMERSGVWINGHHVGFRPMGYVSLRYDVTRHLRTDGPNVLAVRADTSAAPSSRWYNGSGIYRHARLIETDEVHIPQGGAFVSTRELTAESATVSISVEVRNAAARTRSAMIETSILDPSGREVARTRGPVTAVDDGRTEVLSTAMALANPSRWDIDSPILYRAAIRVLGEDGSVLDDQVVPFGIREARFDPATGFWLNGRNMKIKGVALHHDVPAPEFLDLTDELGLLVMNELFDQWNVAKTPNDYHLFFGDWHKRDAADMVRRDRNHPSIVIWSAGNEIHDTAYPVQARAALRS
ncbi:MAG: glycoside hydrolase family 2, partial [Alphaproteobacteria bacterium]